MSRKKGSGLFQIVDLKSVLVVIVMFFVAITQGLVESTTTDTYVPMDLTTLPAYSGSPWIEIDGNVPYFTEDEAVLHAFEDYAALDGWGRCGTAYACINQSLMPTEDRGGISNITPSGWVNREYEIIDGGYLYNRCHLIGFQLTGENDNDRNLITGTRYLNIQGMLPFENMVADHIKEEDHHVLYRVTPVFDGDDLVATGVQMEAFCIECGRQAETDQDKFMFNVFCYNVQPGIEINYRTGESELTETVFDGVENDYVLNVVSMKFHEADCSGAKNISDANRKEVTCTREELIYKGYEPCGSCKP